MTTARRSDIHLDDEGFDVVAVDRPYRLWGFVNVARSRYSRARARGNLPTFPLSGSDVQLTRSRVVQLGTFFWFSALGAVPALLKALRSQTALVYGRSNQSAGSTPYPAVQSAILSYRAFVATNDYSSLTMSVLLALHYRVPVVARDWGEIERFAPSVAWTTGEMEHPATAFADKLADCLEGPLDAPPCHSTHTWPERMHSEMDFLEQKLGVKLPSPTQTLRAETRADYARAS